MQIKLRPATLEDIPLLAEMNEQLIMDEGREAHLTLTQLEERMQGWLNTDRDAVLVEYKVEVIGYLLYRLMQEDHYPYQSIIYVRQFFIHRKYRRRGIGKIAFEKIANHYFPQGFDILLDVLEGNPEGKAFWLKLGFDVYHTTLRRANGRSKL